MTESEDSNGDPGRQCSSEGEAALLDESSAQSRNTQSRRGRGERGRKKWDAQDRRNAQRNRVAE